jgi:DNA-binding beta-propeller fold protein YncE
MRRYSSSGALQASWTVIDAPQGANFTIANTGKIFVAINYEASYVSVIDTSGNVVGRFGRNGVVLGSLSSPRDVVVIGKSIFVSDNGGIQLFTLP